MFGVHAYVVFTIDRLVQNIVRQVWNPFYHQLSYHPATQNYSLSLSLSFSRPQLHSMLSEEGYQVMEQFSVFVEQLSPIHISADQRLPLEMTYQRKIEGILANENCFKLKFVGWAAKRF